MTISLSGEMNLRGFILNNILTQLFMKTKQILLLAVVLPSLFTLVGFARAQGTAFTYQGQLQNNGSPADGTYDLKLRLYDAITNGNLIAGPFTNSALAVSNGLLTTEIDFGSVYDGTNLWLEIGVRTNGAANFAALTPRQPLTPAPYAIFASTSSNLSGTVNVAQLIGNVRNNQLANSSITVNAGVGLGGGGVVALGNSTTLNNAGVLSVSGNADITASIVGGAVTLGDTATSADTASTIVKRDVSGNFSAGSVLLAGNLNLPPATASAGIIYSGASPLINASGSQSFFAGPSAGNLTQTATGNTGVGYLALSSATNGGYNTATGAYSLSIDTTGSQNTANGATALQNNTTGSFNTASGEAALFSNTNGIYNTADGYKALNNNTGGSYNTANGVQVLNNNTSGSYNTGSGVNALFSNTTGNGNAANGYNVLYNNTIGTANTANGSGAMVDNTTGSFNTINGNIALHSNTSGSNNTANGYAALYSNTTGDFNTGDGVQVLNDNETGSNNIALGYQAGFNIDNGNSNIDIGNVGSSSDDNIIRIGSGQSQTFIAGVIQNPLFAGNVGVNTTTPNSSLVVYGGGSGGGNAALARALKVRSSSTFGTAISCDSTSLAGGQDWDFFSTAGTADEGQGKLIFRCDSANTEPMTLTTTEVGIGTTSPDALLSVNGTADKPGGGSWSTFSDRRLKDVGLNFTNGLAALGELQPIYYHYKSDNPLKLPSQPEYIGVVAQQAQSAVPEAVQTNQDGYLIVNNDPIIWTMLNAIKELNQKREIEVTAKDAEIQTLKQQNDTLAQRLNALEATVKQLAQRN
jgi:hypothetical protein